jgi:plasmid maintenance system antidote protein VapI
MPAALVTIDNVNDNHSPLSEPLRRAIVESGISFHQLQEQTGVERASISRFVACKRSLRLDVADRLAAQLGLELRPKAKRRKGD